MSVRADAETLRRIPVFQACDPVPLQILAFTSERMTAALGEQLLTQGRATDSAYLLLSGRIALYLNGTEIGVAEPGSLLGETAMLGGTLSSITAEALDLSYVARISRAMILKVAEEYPEFGEAVFRAVSRRVQASLTEFNEVRDMLRSAKSFSDL
jgi:CRP-like cAMP-binding protein